MSRKAGRLELCVLLLCTALGLCAAPNAVPSCATVYSRPNLRQPSLEKRDERAILWESLRLGPRLGKADGQF